MGQVRRYDVSWRVALWRYDVRPRCAQPADEQSYTYGDSAHLHAATAAAGTSSYTASYDAAGGMTCRAPSGATTCAGTTPTGAQLVYDAERRLQHWQNTQTSPTATDDYLYDGAGQRIQKLSASGGTSTLTSYLGGGVEEAQSVNGGAVTLTKYLGAPGLPQAVRVGTGVSGTLSYLASDGLSSVSEALDSSSGTVTAQQLYAPYGGTRYTSGTMPTSKGYTGQRADSGSSGLDYYGARSYDPVLGQFASADTVADVLNRYGYVHGNPTTFTDPSGHRCNSPADEGCGGDGGIGAGGTSGGTSHCGTCDKSSSANDGGKGVKPKEPTEIEKCNADPQCKQHKQDDANNNILAGSIQLGLELLGLLGGCTVVAAACGAWILFLTGLMGKAMHSIEKGIREFEELNGASPMTRMLTSIIMIFNDIAGMLLNAYNIGATLGKISELTTGVKSLGGLLKAIFTPDGPDGKLFQTVLAARDATLEFFNFTDLQEDTAAFWEASDEWVVSYSSGGRANCGGQACPTPEPVPTPGH